MPRSYQSKGVASVEEGTTSYLVRFDNAVHAALGEESLRTRRSMNTIVNEAVARYLTPSSKSRDTYADVIEKLGGRDE